MCRHRSFAHLRILSLLSSVLIIAAACQSNSPEAPKQDEHIVNANEMIVLETDSTEWHVCTFAVGLVYVEAVQVPVPEPWHLPTREDAKILKDLSYPNSERFITSDGYTFGMPSASVTKAGSKTKYSVLGFYIRKSSIIVEF